MKYWEENKPKIYTFDEDFVIFTSKKTLRDFAKDKTLNILVKVNLDNILRIPEGYTISDLFKDNAKRVGREPRNDVENYLYSRYEIRENKVTQRNEIKDRNETSFEELNKKKFNSILNDLENQNIKCTEPKLQRIIESDFVGQYDPFREYFTKLKWDKKVDYIDLLASTIKTDADDLWKRSFKKWIVGVVACSFNTDLVNQQVLVLVGGQGIGKTTWLNNLLPKKLKGYLYSGTITPGEKDSLLKLSDRLLINLDELENLNKSELGSLKSFVTESVIDIRRAYAVYSETYQRRASFMGSVNNAEFLTDTTGNRRYLCFTAEDIDYTTKINMDLVYGQAMNLFTYDNRKEKPFRWWFNSEEIKEIDEHNKRYLRTSFEEDFINKYFEVPKDSENNFYLTPSDILAFIQKKENVILSLKKLGECMTKVGFSKKSMKTSKAYIVKFRAEEDWLDEASGKESSPKDVEKDSSKKEKKNNESKKTEEVKFETTEFLVKNGIKYNPKTHVVINGQLMEKKPFKGFN